MKSRIVMSLCLCLLLVGASFATSNFTGAIDEYWSNPDNWSNGVPVDETAKIQGGGLCILDYAAPDVTSLNIRVGGSTLRLVEGAVLNATSWTAVAYNSAPQDNRCILEVFGGVLNMHSHMRVGNNGFGLMVIDHGGMVNLHDNEFRVGWDAGAEGIVELRGGSLNILEGADALPLVFRNSPDTAAHMDFSGGAMTMGYSDERLQFINDHIDDGTITAYYDFPRDVVDYAFDIKHAVGTVVVESIDHDGDLAFDSLIVKGLHPMAPGPEDGGNVVPGSVTLSWTLPDPCVPGQAVPVDVYFTDDYEALKNFLNPGSIQLAAQQNLSSLTVQVEPKKRYYWAVDTYQGTDNDPVWGPIFQFYADNIAPEVSTTPDVTTWLDNGSANVTLGGIATDSDPVTTAWTVISEPNEGAAVIADAMQIDTIATLTAMGTYVLQLEADDGEKQGADTLTITVFADACQAAQSLPDYEPLPGDLDEDCDVDQDDLDILMAYWLECVSLGQCDPNNPNGL